ncbi:ABC transporter permease [Bacillus sp. FJAT-49732]|uniref:Transport permease protein n=1 Tax=Lederbergia citrisecunda TaxID=2833583 RepID=A0A942TQR1_9BACI|nr:ABC transporter permease [Lederbergia citrisecunda]MBS4201166.1 ABC transporter permease [Lederbergia citrisecunda]
MKQFRKLFEANFKSTFREKAVWGWSIAFPVLLMVIFLTVFAGVNGDDTSFEANIVTVMEEPNELATSLETTLKYIPMLTWKEDSPVSRKQAETWLKNKKIDAAILLPTSPDAKSVELLLNKEKENSTLSQIMGGIVNSILQETNYQMAGVTPQLSMKTEYVSSGSDQLKYTDFLVTGMIALSIAQAGLFGMVSLIEMRRNGLLKRLMLTPITMKTFGLSISLVRLILSIVQIVLLTLIGVLFFKASLHVNILSFIIIFIIGTITFSAFGFMITAFTKSMDGYMGLANIFSFLMMFLSGIFFELSILPSYIKPISIISPLTYFANGIRDSMIYGLSIMHTQFWLNIGILALWAVVTFAVGARFFKWEA